MNNIDIISMDVPLFIRMLEYAREDSKNDMDLHKVTEKIMSLNQHKHHLGMEDYNEIMDISEISERFKKLAGIK